MLIRVGGIDPALRNFGLAAGDFNIDEDRLVIDKIRTQHTEKETGKLVRQSSDDLRCASLQVQATHLWIRDCAAVFAEVPSGSQSARGSFSNGVCLGILGSVGNVGSFKGRLIQVNPSEVKRAAVGSKNASKEEMVMWAATLFPELPWVIATRGAFKGKPSPDQNEHMADAVAAINAGVKTDEFRSLVQMVRSLNIAPVKI